MKALTGILILAATVALGQTEAERIDQAKMHFRVAEIALEKGDLKVAASALRKALELDPNNALIHYNLARVQKAEDPEAAMASLKRARAIGLPEKVKEASIGLEAEITYELEKQREANSPANKLA